MQKFKCKKCNSSVDEKDTYLSAGKAKIAMNPQQPNDQSVNIPVPIRKHQHCAGEVVPN